MSLRSRLTTRENHGSRRALSRHTPLVLSLTHIHTHTPTISISRHGEESRSVDSTRDPLGDDSFPISSHTSEASSFFIPFSFSLSSFLSAFTRILTVCQFVRPSIHPFSILLSLPLSVHVDTSPLIRYDSITLLFLSCPALLSCVHFRSCWSCSIAKIPVSATFLRPCCTGFTANSWVLELSSANRSTTSFCGKTMRSKINKRVHFSFPLLPLFTRHHVSLLFADLFTRRSTLTVWVSCWKFSGGIKNYCIVRNRIVA